MTFSLRELLEPKTTRPLLLLLFLFFTLFYVLFPRLISQSVDKQDTFIDWFPMTIKGGDYVATYVASKSLRAGHNIYLNNAPRGDKYRDQFADGKYSRYSYTPLQAYIFYPLSTFPFEKSYALWSIVSKVLIFVSILLISSLTKYSKIAFIFLTLFYWLSSFFWFQIERGQTDTLLVFFLALSFFLYFKKRAIPWAALFFSLAVLLKVFPLVFAIFFLLRKEYKFLLYTALFSFLIILATRFNTWSYWFTSILPTYTNYYLGSEVDHSLAYLLSGFWDQGFPQAVKVARILSVIFILLYIVVGYLNKNKSRNLLLIELATLSIIADISTPWSANYKLVTLLVLFAAPFFILEEETMKNRVFLTVPLLIAFLFLSPIYNEFYGRVLFSFLSTVSPGEFVAYHPIHKIAEFRVSLALLFSLLYLFSLQIYLLVRNTNFFKNVLNFFRGHKVPAVAFAAILFLILGGALIYSGSRNSRNLRTTYVEKVESHGTENKVSDSLSLAGFEVTKKASGSYDVELILKVNRKLNHHYAFFIHGHHLDQDVTEGINFFPYILVNFWPPGKYVVIKKTVNLTAKPQRITFGLFDISDGARYGEEVELGVIHLDKLQ